MAGPEQPAPKPQAPSRLVPGSEHSRKHTCPPAPIPVLPAAWPPSPTPSSVMAHRREVLLQLKGRDNEHFISHFILSTTPEVGAMKYILPMLKTFRALPDAIMASKWHNQDSSQVGLAQAPPEQPPEGPYKCPHLSQIHSLCMCWAACLQVTGLLSGMGEQGRAQGLGHSLQVPAEGWNVMECLSAHPDHVLFSPGSRE